MICRSAGLIVLSLAWSAARSAEPSRSGPVVILEPTVITEPGQYVLGADLTSPGPSFCVVEIAASDVDLDLGGFRIETVDRSKANAICAHDVHGIAVHDGFLTTGSFGDDAYAIYLANVESFALERITVQAQLESSVVIDGGRQGLVAGNAFMGSEGLFIEGEDLDIASNVFNGDLVIRGTRLHVAGNRLTHYPGEVNDLGGLFLEGNENVVENNVLAGVTVYPATSRENRIENNVIHGGHGIRIHGGRNRIHGNTITVNSEFGLYFVWGSESNVYGGNRAFGNGGQQCDAPSGSADFCDLGSHNQSLGDNYLPDRR